MVDIIHTLSATALSQAIQNYEWIVPTLQSFHILAVSVVLSSVGLIVLRLMGWAGTRTSVPDTAKRYIPWIWGAIILLAVSGTLLIIGEPRRELTNTAFQVKMVLVLCGIALIAGFQASTSRHPDFWNHEPESPRIRLMAVCALLLFFAIAVAGRWIAYVVMDYAAA
jgi:hypothetical protein